MAKKITKPILKYYLGFITKLVLLINRPVVIAVAGSINKPFVKQQLKEVLQENKQSVRANPKNFNTEIGLPLAVMNLPSGYNSYKNWLPAVLEAPKRIFEKDFPKFLVLSFGTSDPGDTSYLLKIVKPSILVITDISQRYIEGFRDMDQLSKEYELLCKNIKRNGFAIVNFDNPRVRQICETSKVKCISFGGDENCDWQILKIEKVIDGQEVSYKHNNKTYTKKQKLFGKHHAQALIVREIMANYVQGEFKTNKHD